jgi:hypothetical protein
MAFHRLSSVFHIRDFLFSHKSFPNLFNQSDKFFPTLPTLLPISPITLSNHSSQYLRNSSNSSLLILDIALSISFQGLVNQFVIFLHNQLLLNANPRASLPNFHITEFTINFVHKLEASQLSNVCIRVSFVQMSKASTNAFVVLIHLFPHFHIPSKAFSHSRILVHQNISFANTEVALSKTQNSHISAKNHHNQVPLPSGSYSNGLHSTHFKYCSCGVIDVYCKALLYLSCANCSTVQVYQSLLTAVV